jgi:hypothetical protein
VAAAGRAIAAAMSGIPYDRGSAGFRCGGPFSGAFPGSGRIRIMDHIFVYHSIRGRGLGWLTTSGMAKFGLLDLEAREVPPGLASGVAGVLNGTAQLLAERVLDLADRASGRPPGEIRLDQQVLLRAADLAAARGEEPGTADRGAARVRLSRDGHGGSGEACHLIAVEPPSCFEGTRVSWFQGLLADLLEGSIEGGLTDAALGGSKD